MRKFIFVSLMISLCIFSSGMVNASDQLQIIFNDGIGLSPLSRRKYGLYKVHHQAACFVCCSVLHPCG